MFRLSVKIGKDSPTFQLFANRQMHGQVVTIRRTVRPVDELRGPSPGWSFSQRRANT